MIENNHIAALVAALIFAYIIYKSFFADKQTVIETVTENKKEPEAVVESAAPAKAVEEVKVDAVKLSDIVSNQPKKATRKPRTPKVAATAPKSKTKKVKKNG